MAESAIPSFDPDAARRFLDTVSWQLDLEPLGKPSPWLSIRALEISAALDASPPSL
jgi:hypothetical protein